MPDVLGRAYIVCMGTIILGTALLIPLATLICVRFNTGPAILLVVPIPSVLGITAGLVYLRNARSG